MKLAYGSVPPQYPSESLVLCEYMVFKVSPSIIAFNLSLPGLALIHKLVNKRDLLTMFHVGNNGTRKPRQTSKD